MNYLVGEGVVSRLVCVGTSYLSLSQNRANVSHYFVILIAIIIIRVFCRHMIIDDSRHSFRSHLTRFPQSLVC